MSALDFLLQWDSQPQEAVGVDWGNQDTLSLAGVWPLVDGFRDATGRNSGTLNAGVTQSVSQLGRTLTFNGTSGVATLPTPPAGTSLTAINSSVSFWIYPTNLTGFRVIFHQWNGSNGPILYCNGTSLIWQIGPSGGSITAAAGIELDKWQHFVCTYSGTNALAIYKNGVLLQSGNPGGISNIAHTIAAQWGGTTTYGWYTSGQMAAPAMWTRGLSAVEARRQYEATWQLFAPRSIWVPNAEAFASSRFNKPLRVPSVRTTQPQEETSAELPTNFLLNSAMGARNSGALLPGFLTTSGTLTTSVFLAGRTLKFSGSNYLVMGTQQTNLADAVTVVALVQADAAGFYPMIVSGNNGGTDILELRLFGSSGRPEFTVRTSGGVGAYAGAASIVGIGPVCLVGVYAANQVALYANGKLIANGPTGVGSVSWGTHDWRMGDRAVTAGYAFTGDIASVSVHPFAFNANLAASVSANPWQLFAPQEKFIQTAYTPKAPWSVTKSRMLGTGTGAPAQVATATRKRVSWRSQPQGAVEVDWGNSITKGLLSLDIPVNNRVLTAVNAPNYLISPHGVGFKGNGSNSGWYKNLPGNGINTATTSVTVMALVFGNATSTDRRLYGTADASSMVCYIGSGTSSAAKMRLWYRTPGGDFGSADTTATVFESNVPHLAIMRYSAGTTGLLAAFVDGNKDVSQVVTVTGISDTLQVGIGALARSSSLSVFTATTCMVGAFWARGLSDEEIKSVSANPWQLFSPRSVQIPVGVNL